jgi:hypothetical protein
MGGTLGQTPEEPKERMAMKESKEPKKSKVTVKTKDQLYELLAEAFIDKYLNDPPKDKEEVIKWCAQRFEEDFVILKSEVMIEYDDYMRWGLRLYEKQSIVENRNYTAVNEFRDIIKSYIKKTYVNQPEYLSMEKRFINAADDIFEVMKNDPKYTFVISSNTILKMNVHEWALDAHHEMMREFVERFPNLT